MRIAPSAAENAGAEARPADGPTPEGRGLEGLAVLIAEDQPETLRALTVLLERAGAAVRPCDTPVSAAEAVDKDPNAWDLLITDYEMPGLDGAGLAQRVRGVAPRMPILLCTGAAEIEVARVSSLFDGVLGKPTNEAELIAAARRALALRAGREA